MTADRNRNQFDAFATYDYVAELGFTKCVAIPLTAWVLAAGTPPIAATTNIVGVGAVATTLIGHIWDSGADGSDTLLLPWTLPSDFYRGGTQAGMKTALILRVKARKRDVDLTNTTATLALTLDAYWHNSNLSRSAFTETDGDTTVNHLTAVITTAALPAPVAAASEEAFRWYEFDIGAAMTDAQRAALTPGATMQLLLSPSTTVGGNDFIEAVGYEILYRGHLVPADKPYRARGFA